ncbi:hypothetical protein VB10N_16960 [Vibrio sp. 10N]|nr:hypothetical protein VB10N_16960 [Vibrio sp. 10N]
MFTEITMLKSIKFKYSRLLLKLLKNDRIYLATFIKSWATLASITVLVLSISLLIDRLNMLDEFSFRIAMIKYAIGIVASIISVLDSYEKCRCIKLKSISKALNRKHNVQT